LEIFIPSLSADPEFRTWYGRFERLSASPGAAIAIQRMNMHIDVRPLLRTLRVPTLVLFRAGEIAAHVEGSRYLAEHIPGATFVEFEGQDFVPYVGDQDAILDAIEEFVTGTSAVREPDRILTTVLFTDIVDSTKRAVEVGDRRWHELLDRHDALIEHALERHRGRKINTTGDGVLAVFDGPARAVRCACSIRDGLSSLDLPVRAGVHTGEVELRGDDVGGLAVHIGARVAALCSAGEILVTRTVTDLVAGSGIEFVDRGKQVLRGVPGFWHLFAAQC